MECTQSSARRRCYLSLSRPFSVNIRSSGRPKHSSRVPSLLHRPHPPLGFAQTASLFTIGARASQSHWPLGWFATTASQYVPLWSLIGQTFGILIAKEPPLSVP